MTELQRSFSTANEELVAAFARYLIGRNLSPHTVRSYVDSVSRLAEQFASTSLLTAQNWDIRELLSGLQERGLHPSTLALHTSAIKTFYGEFLQAFGFIDRDPTIRIKRRKIPIRIPRALTVAEVEKYIATAETPFERALVETLYATGARCDEAVHIQMQDVDFPNRTIRITHGKGGKERFVLFGQYAESAIRDYLATRQNLNADTPLFPYTDGWIRHVVKAIAKRGGLGRVHPHMLRRSMASHMVQNGADLRYVQELLGHALVSTTMRYVVLSTQDLLAAYEKYHPHAAAESEASIATSSVAATA